MEDMLDFLGANGALINSSSGVPQVSDKKRKHKLTEQKGRQKINDQINELKSLLPECRYVNTTKASILECAVNSLKRMQAVGNQLILANKKLMKENKRLRSELEKFDPNIASTWDLNELDAPEEPIPNLALSNSLNSISEFLHDGIGSSPSIDPYLSPVEFSSMPNSSPPTSSPPIPFTYMPPQMPIDNSSDFSSSPSSFSSDDYNIHHKVSKRRLLLVILLLIPFFVSFDGWMKTPFPTSSPDIAPGTHKQLLSFTISPAEIISAFYYFDIARFGLYVVLGIVGLHWTANTLLWFKQLQPELEGKGFC